MTVYALLGLSIAVRRGSWPGQVCLHGNTLSGAQNVPSRVKLMRKVEVVGVSAKMIISVKREQWTDLGPPRETRLTQATGDDSSLPVTFWANSLLRSSPGGQVQRFLPCRLPHWVPALLVASLYFSEANFVLLFHDFCVSGAEGLCGSSAHH